MGEFNVAHGENIETAIDFCRTIAFDAVVDQVKAIAQGRLKTIREYDPHGWKEKANKENVFKHLRYLAPTMTNDEFWGWLMSESDEDRAIEVLVNDAIVQSYAAARDEDDEVGSADLGGDSTIEGKDYSRPQPKSRTNKFKPFPRGSEKGKLNPLADDDDDTDYNTMRKEMLGNMRTDL